MYTYISVSAVIILEPYDTAVSFQSTRRGSLSGYLWPDEGRTTSEGSSLRASIACWSDAFEIECFHKRRNTICFTRIFPCGYRVSRMRTAVLSKASNSTNTIALTAQSVKLSKIKSRSFQNPAFRNRLTNSMGRPGQWERQTITSPWLGRLRDRKSRLCFETCGRDEIMFIKSGRE